MDSLVSATNERRLHAALYGVSDFSVLIGRILFGLFAFMLYLCVLLWNNIGLTWGPFPSAVLALSAFALHVLLVRRRVGSMDPAIWVVVSMLMFYFGAPIAIELIYDHAPIAGYDLWNVGGSPSRDRGYALALLTFISLIWGMYLAGFRNLARDLEPSDLDDQSLTLPAYLLTFVGLAMTTFGIILVGGPAVVFGTYGDWWAAKGAGADARFVDVGIMVIAAGAFALIASANRSRRAQLYFAYAIVLLVALINVQKGARAILIATLIGAGWCYTQRIRRLPWKWVLLGAFVALIALPVLREWRHSRTIEMSKSATVRDLAAEALMGMGGTVEIFGYTLDYVPRTKAFAHGETYWMAIAASIPNLGLTPGKSWGNTSAEDHPSRWITCKISPAWCAEGGGYGFAMGAEFYYNFGFTGVLLGGALWGYLTGRIRNAARISSFNLVASALFMGNTAVFVRNILAAPLKSFLWPLALLVALKWLVSAFAQPPPRAVDAADDIA